MILNQTANCEKIDEGKFWEKNWFLLWHCHAGIYSYPIRLAIKLNVPLIVYGEPLAEMSAYYSYDEIEHEDEEKFDNVRTLGISADDMFEWLILKRTL